MIWLALAKRYWKVAAVLAVVGLFWFSLNRALTLAEQTGYARATSDMQSAIIAANESTAAIEAEEREISRAHDIHYQQVQRDLQARIDALTRSTVDLGRLQVRTRTDCPAAGGAAAAAPVVDGGAGAGGHDLQAGESAESELGLQLVRFAGECELNRRQLIELQAWVEALAPQR